MSPKARTGLFAATLVAAVIAATTFAVVARNRPWLPESPPSQQSAVSEAKKKDYKVSPEVKAAWEKWIDQQKVGEFWFVVAYHQASKSWMTLQREEANYDVPGLGAEFLVKRGFDRGTPSFDSLARKRNWDPSDPKRIVEADTDKQLLTTYAISQPEMSYVAIIDAHGPKVISTHADKSLAPVKLPADVSDRLNFYLYYLQHAAAGYSWEDVVRGK